MKETTTMKREKNVDTLKMCTSHARHPNLSLGSGTFST